MLRRRKMLATILDPLNRPANPARERGHQQLLRKDVRFQPKSSSDIGRDHPNRMLRNVYNSSNLGAKDEEHLGGRPHGERLRHSVPRRRDSASFDRKRQMAPGAKSF